MHWLDLPPPRRTIPPAFDNINAAREWLAAQPQADPVPMQNVLLRQIESLDGSDLPAAEKLPLLDFLRSAALPVQEILEPRYLRKQLPMAAAEQSVFEASQQLWTQLGLSYLRIAPHFAHGERLTPLHRAASSLRLAEYCHLQAAQECPPLLDQLLFATLAQAEQIGVLRAPLSDPDFRHLGESNIAGHVAWAFMLRLIDPYKLNSHQLAVANRAISRWRELAGFQAMPDSDPKSRAIPLAALLGQTIPEGLPSWLDIRAIERKIKHRVESLQAGYSPETLKLGNELSSAACIRLLHGIRDAFSQRNQTPNTEVGDLPLVFGIDRIYALFAGKPLNSQGLETGSATLAHQRVAMFGFDRVSQLPNAVHTLNIPTETWTLVDGLALRPAEAGDRHTSPVLVAASYDKGPRLGVLLGLRRSLDGALRAQLSWFPETVASGIIERQSAGQTQRIPVFMMNNDGRYYLIAPAAAAIKLDVGLTIDMAKPRHLTPTEVSERGTDFVRYLCHNA